MRRFTDEQLSDLKTEEEQLQDICKQIDKLRFRRDMLEIQYRGHIRDLDSEIKRLEEERERINVHDT